MFCNRSKNWWMTETMNVKGSMESVDWLGYYLYWSLVIEWLVRRFQPKFF